MGESKKQESFCKSNQNGIYVLFFVAQRKHEVERIRQQFPNKIPVCNFSWHTHHYTAVGGCEALLSACLYVCPHVYL